METVTVMVEEEGGRKVEYDFPEGGAEQKARNLIVESREAGYFGARVMAVTCPAQGWAVCPSPTGNPQSICLRP